MTRYWSSNHTIYDAPGGVTASSSVTVTSTTSPGTNVLCAITEAIATNFACRLVAGPKQERHRRCQFQRHVTVFIFRDY